MGELLWFVFDLLSQKVYLKKLPLSYLKGIGARPAGKNGVKLLEKRIFGGWYLMYPPFLLWLKIEVF